MRFSYPSCAFFTLAMAWLVSSTNAYFMSRLSMSSERQHLIDAPLLSAITEKSGQLASTFFLPNHQLGRHCCQIGKDVLGSRSYELDLPELDGLGNVHEFKPNNDDAISKALRKASYFMGAMRTWFLVNGSTSGVLIAMMVLKDLHSSRCSDGKRGTVMVTRDCHKSVFDALEIANCDAWVLPCNVDDEFGISIGVDSDLIIENIIMFREKYGQSADLIGIILTRPTYQGVGLHSSHFELLVRNIHAHQVPVVVDEAHGSHWRLLDSESGYGDALSCGADLVIQSTHKTLGALSQAGMLHLGNDAFSCIQLPLTRIEKLVHHYYSTFTSTSPNILLLASIDAARAHAAMSGIRDAETSSESVLKLLKEFRKTTYSNEITFLSDKLRGDRLVIDPLRLTIHFKKYPNQAVDIDNWICERYGVWCELNLPRCIVYCLPLGAREKDLAILVSALSDTVSALQSDNIVVSEISGDGEVTGFEGERYGTYLRPKSLSASCTSVPLHTAINMISAENVVSYPPGIPILLRGETILQHHVDTLSNLKSHLGSGRCVLCMDPSLSSVYVYC